MRLLSLKEYRVHLITYRQFKWLVKIGLVVFTVLFMALFIHSDLGKGKTVHIYEGATLSGISHHLRARDIIYSTLLFKGLVYLTGHSASLHSGTYFFPAGSSLWDVYETLLSGKTTFARLTIPEGLTVQQIMELIQKSPDVVGECPSDLEEGSLLPETYFFDFGIQCSTLISQMKDMMYKTVDTVWESREVSSFISSKKELVVLASIVEKETAKAEERPIVASVFLNRLEKGMRLQTDPTVVYAITNGYGHMRGQRLLLRHLKTESLYNTYLHAGLPPRPIANPGKASLMAVVHPEKTSYLFFVADGTGGHVFSDTLLEHEKKRKEWRKIRDSN